MALGSSHKARITVVRDGKHVSLSMEDLGKLLDNNPSLAKTQRKKSSKSSKS